MDIREGKNIGRPPLLESHNYGIWKAKMKAFLMYVDELAWMAVETEYVRPTVTGVDGKVTEKSPLEWTSNERLLAAGNSKAVNALIAAVDDENFTLIQDSKNAKEAWETLQVAFEGTIKVKMNKLQMVTTKFEALRMQGDETISEYFQNVKDLSNEAATLGEPISQEKIVRKLLRSLPARFDTKIYAIEEAHDITNIPLQELIGILKTHEMNLNAKGIGVKKSKDIGLKTEIKEESEVDEDLATDIAAVTKQFKKFLKRYSNYKRFRGSSSNEKYQRDEYDKRKPDHYLENQIQCRECMGYGHIQAECANTLKKKKPCKVILSDTDSDQSGEEVQTNLLALTSVLNIVPDQPDAETLEGITTGPSVEANITILKEVPEKKKARRERLCCCNKSGHIQKRCSEFRKCYKKKVSEAQVFDTGERKKYKTPKERYDDQWYSKKQRRRLPRFSSYYQEEKEYRATEDKCADISTTTLNGNELEPLRLLMGLREAN